MTQLRDNPLTSDDVTSDKKFIMIGDEPGQAYNLPISELSGVLQAEELEGVTAPQTSEILVLENGVYKAMSWEQLLAQLRLDLGGIDTGPPPTGQGTYYVDAVSGSDNNDGRTPLTAFQSIAKINALSYLPNDQIFFKRGQTHFGALTLTFSSGSIGLSILFTGYGSGPRPVIASEDAVGFTATNKHHFTLDGLDFLGGTLESNGTRTANAVDGIRIVNNQAGDTKLAGIRIINCQVREYGHSGIKLYGDNGAAGFDAPVIDACTVFNCTHNASDGTQASGISVASVGFGAAGFGYSHQSVVIRNCSTYDLVGTAGDSSWNGSGIYVASTDVANITKCIAYACGRFNNNARGGFGIWTEDSNEVLIQECESYLNLLNTSVLDGGGFCIGGGCTGCIIERCYSHENRGNGFKLYAGVDVNFEAWDNNTIRYCISQGDHINAFDFGGNIAVTADANMINVRVHNNIIYQNGGSPRNALMLRSTTGALITDYEGYIANNIIVTKSTSALVQADSMNTQFMRLRGNNYWALGTFVIEWNGNDYGSIAAWQAVATTQEKIDAVSVAVNLDPQLVDPGNGQTINATNSQLNAYKLKSSSPMVGVGLDLLDEFTIDPGTIDFHGNTVAAPFNIGASYSILDVPLAITGEPVLTAVEDDVYQGFTVQGAGGLPPYVYSLVGSWPTGITIDSSTGIVSGSPIDDGTYASLSVRVTDDNANTADLATFTITVSASPFNPAAVQVPNGTSTGTILYTLTSVLPTPTYTIIGGGDGLAIEGANVYLEDKALFYAAAAGTGNDTTFRATSGASIENIPVIFQASAGFFDPGTLGNNVGMWWDATDHTSMLTDENDTYIVQFTDKSNYERHMINPWFLDRRQRLTTSALGSSKRAMREVQFSTSSTYGLTCRDAPVWHGMRYVRIANNTTIELVQAKEDNNTNKTIFTGLPALFGANHIVVIWGNATTCQIRVDGVLRGTKTVGAGYFPPDNSFVIAFSFNITSTVAAQILSPSHLGQHPFWEGGAFAGDVAEFIQLFNVTGTT